MWLKVKELRRLIAGLGFRLIQNCKSHPEENAHLKRSPRADDGEFSIPRILKIKILEETLSYLYYDNNIREYSALDYQTPYPYLKRKPPEGDDKIRFARPIILDEAVVELGPWSGDNVLAQHHYIYKFLAEKGILGKRAMQPNVHHYQQGKSMSCGLAVLRMVFEFLGEQLMEKELSENLKMHSFGTLLTDLGVIALNRGYKVTSYTFHLPLLAPLRIDFGSRIKKGHLQKIKPRPSDRMTFESWKRYLSQGGCLIWDFPKIVLVKNWINKDIPCIININTAALNRYWRNWDNGHFLVVNGIERKEISVLDPDLPGNKGKYVIKNDLLLPAWAINAKRSSGYLMVIEKDSKK
ncbi:C39 family peptidase [Candidatus Shapirobacteria bacterium]|nr:C39 family peptidase [Candidatus Shapirobacteria bacterium]